MSGRRASQILEPRLYAPSHGTFGDSDGLRQRRPGGRSGGPIGGSNGPWLPFLLYTSYNPPMALTAGDILRIPGLSLRLVAGRRGLNRVIRWAHVSELEDPSAWLKGGELLLMTGMGIGKTPARQRAYVKKLSEAGLAGLGFGLGFSHTKVPKPLVDAAEALGFPLFEVPYEVPFIAITEAVFTQVVAGQFDFLQRASEAQNALT